MAEVLLAPAISLDTSECSSDDVARFVPLFQSVWNGLPAFVRRVLLLHWQDRPTSPFVQLHSFGKNSAGNTRSNGHDLRFNSDLFRIMPDWCGTTAIAHELGHILFLATGEKWHAQAEAIPGRFVPTWACELINLELTRRWGYKQDEFSEWINCEVSHKGPHLRTTAGEPPFDAAVYREKLVSMTARWAREQGIGGEEAADEAYRALIRSKEPYYRMATTDGESYEAVVTTNLDALRTLLHQQSDQEKP